MRLSRYVKQGMLAGLAAGGLALATAPAQAVPVTSAGTLKLGSLTFSNFSCNKTGSGLPQNCGDIDVETDANLPGLTFNSYFADGSEWAAGEDFVISYAVTDTGAPITGLDLEFNGTANSWAGFAISSVTETAYTDPSEKHQVGQLTVDCFDGQCTDGSVISTGSYTTLYVKKDILLGNLGPGYETISYIDQSFHVPEPMTLALFGTGLLGLGLVQRRRHVA